MSSTPATALRGRALSLARDRRVQRTVGITVAVIALGGVVGLILAHLDELLAREWRFDVPRLIASLVLQASTIGIATLVWADLSHRLGANWDLRRDTRAYALALLARRLPGSFWHVLGRAAFYGDVVGLGRRVGLVGSLVEAGLLVLTGACLALMALSELRPWGAWLGLGGLAVGPLAFGPAFRLMFGQRAAWLPSVGRLYLWTAADCLAWLLGATGVFLLFDGLYPLDQQHWPDVVAAVTSSIVISSAVVFVPGGLGLRELTLAGMLARAIPQEVALALALAFRISIATIEALWAVAVVLLVRPARPR